MWQWLEILNLFNILTLNILTFNPFSANFTKWLNTLKQFVGNLPTNFLSVFDHFVGLVFKGLITHGFYAIYQMKPSWCNELVTDMPGFSQYESDIGTDISIISIEIIGISNQKNRYTRLINNVTVSFHMCC